LQHRLSQHNTIEVEDDCDIEFDEEIDEVFEGKSSNSTLNFEIAISDDDEEEEDNSDREEDEEDASSDAPSSAVNVREQSSNAENLEEALLAIYKATDKILNDHARAVAIRQVISHYLK